MLVITRRNQQSFRIGDDIKVHILGVDKSNIKIGIEAPREVLILRSELEDKICRSIK